MALRTLADEYGRQWQIWDVHPTGIRRRFVEGLPADDGSQTAPDRETHRSAVMLPVTLRSGWLAFQCEDDSRRLAPIPPDWESMPDRALIELLTCAKPARLRAG